MVEAEALPADDVQHHMSTELVTADASTPVAALAGLMLGRGVHRVIVLDPEGRPVGVVSASDILRAVARTAGEECGR